MMIVTETTAVGDMISKKDVEYPKAVDFTKDMNGDLYLIDKDGHTVTVYIHGYFSQVQIFNK